jgi:hypothetical protein
MHGFLPDLTFGLRSLYSGAVRCAISQICATARARGWAIWKAFITVMQHRDTNPNAAQEARQIIGDVLDDHSRAARQEP